MSKRKPSPATSPPDNPPEYKRRSFGPSALLCVTPGKCEPDPTNFNTEKIIRDTFGINDKIRKIVEKSNPPQSQCNSSIGNYSLVEYDPKINYVPMLDSNIYSDRCWLCGFPLFSDENIRGKEVQDVSVHCEHILPILVATVFTGIAGNDQSRPKKTTEVYDKMAKKNYAWAHAGCNLAKSNAVLFKYDEQSERMVFDASAAEILANKITNRVFLQINLSGIQTNLYDSYRNYGLVTDTSTESETVFNVGRITQNSNWYASFTYFMKKEMYTSNLIQHYSGVIDKIVEDMNKEIASFGQSNGDSNINKYLVNALSLVYDRFEQYLGSNLDKIDVYQAIRNVYDFMDKKNVHNSIQQIHIEIDHIKANKKNSLSEEERKEQEERINKLNQDIESLKTIGTILNVPWAPMKPNDGSSSNENVYDLADRWYGGKTKKKLRKRRRTRKSKNIR